MTAKKDSKGDSKKAKGPRDNARVKPAAGHQTTDSATAQAKVNAAVPKSAGKPGSVDPPDILHQSWQEWRIAQRSQSCEFLEASVKEMKNAQTRVYVKRRRQFINATMTPIAQRVKTEAATRAATAAQTRETAAPTAVAQPVLTKEAVIAPLQATSAKDVAEEPYKTTADASKQEVESEVQVDHAEHLAGGGRSPQSSHRRPCRCTTAWRRPSASIRSQRLVQISPTPTRGCTHHAALTPSWRRRASPWRAVSTASTGRSASSARLRRRSSPSRPSQAEARALTVIVQTGQRSGPSKRCSAR